MSLVSSLSSPRSLSLSNGAVPVMRSVSLSLLTGGAVRVEHVVDGHVRRGLTRIRLRSGLRGRTGAGLFVRPGSGLVAGTGVGFRRGLVAACGRLHVGFGLDSRGRAHGRIVRIRGGHGRRA